LRDPGNSLQPPISSEQSELWRELGGRAFHRNSIPLVRPFGRKNGQMSLWQSPSGGHFHCVSSSDMKWFPPVIWPIWLESDLSSVVPSADRKQTVFVSV
jgi:hypothetical protein